MKYRHNVLSGGEEINRITEEASTTPQSLAQRRKQKQTRISIGTMVWGRTNKSIQRRSEHDSTIACPAAKNKQEELSAEWLVWGRKKKSTSGWPAQEGSTNTEHTHQQNGLSGEEKINRFSKKRARHHKRLRKSEKQWTRIIGTMACLKAKKETNSKKKRARQHNRLPNKKNYRHNGLSGGEKRHRHQDGLPRSKEQMKKKYQQNGLSGGDKIKRFKKWARHHKSLPKSEKL